MHAFFFYAQSPDFHKLGLCYYLKISYLFITCNAFKRTLDR